MSVKSERTDALVDWINKNAFWRQELQIKPSKFGGLGVFIEDLSALDEDPLLLRIPKCNLLNAKTSSIYNLLCDYEWENVDISEGMFALIISVIYELSFSKESPWYGYLQSINFEDSFIPVCLWSDDDKLNLKNSQIDLLNLLDATELVQFYQECKRFAQINQHILPLPQCLLGDDAASLREFSKIITSVTSRSFTIDNYQDLSLVPAADLFNHLSPIVKDGVVTPQENIHFICDGSVCSECGEQECDHEEEEEEEEEDELQEFDEDGNIVVDENEDDENEDDDENDENDENEEVEEDEGDEDEEGDEDGNDDDEDDNIETENNEEHDEEDAMSDISEITMDYIQKMEVELEEDSETETIVESEEESTIESPEDDENEADPIDDELAKELSDSSKCCDVVLMKPPSEEHNYEIFNSYGNDLSNVDLLQRYGFICPENPNDSCLLSVQAFKYIKDIKSKLSGAKVKQLEEKLEWFESIGFELVNEIIALEHSHDHHHEHPHDHDDEDEDCCLEISLPETWQLSVKVNYDGSVSPQTYCLINLIELSPKIFKHKLLPAKKKQLQQRLKELLIEPKDNSIIKNWCKDRLSRYNKLVPSDNYDTIEQLIKQEQSILKRFIESN